MVLMKYDFCATVDGYSIANVQAADAGNYSVIVSNSFGSVTSSVATLTVTNGGFDFLRAI